MKLYTINNKFFTLEVYLSVDGYMHGRLTYKYRSKVYRVPIPAYFSNDYGFNLPKLIQRELQRSLLVQLLFPELIPSKNEPKAL